jgi:hypothetical protein
MGLLMTTFDHDQTGTEVGGFCPECGQPAGTSNFCSRCGHNMGFAADRTLADAASQPSNADGEEPRRRAGFIIAAVVVALVAVAVAVIVLLNSHTSKARSAGAPTPSASTVYRQQLTKVLTPVISANQTVASSLTAMDGSKQTTKTAKTSVAAALAALGGARGGLGVLSTPSADSTLSAQVQQALTADNGYMEAVSSTLATPSGTGAGQLQTLATGAESALVNLDPVVSGASSSINGTDNLVSWAQGGSAARKAPAPKPNTNAEPQTFTGNANENVGSIKVSDPSTLSWQCTSCGTGNFIIDNNNNDTNQFDVNALDQTRGSTYVDPGTYTDVSIATEGQAWSFTITPGNSTQHSTSNVPAEPPAATQTDPPSSSTTTPETTAPTSPSSPDGNPLGTVDNYWHAINSGAYAEAWSDVAPGARAPSPSVFARSEEQEGVQGASFSGQTSSLDGDSATVDVDSLITHDNAGCQSWTGTYGLSDEGGRWLITQAAVTPHPCG